MDLKLYPSVSRRQNRATVRVPVSAVAVHILDLQPYMEETEILQAFKVNIDEGPDYQCRSLGVR